jgi:hypothetical protein
MAPVLSPVLSLAQLPVRVNSPVVNTGASPFTSPVINTGASPFTGPVTIPVASPGPDPVTNHVTSPVPAANTILSLVLSSVLSQIVLGKDVPFLHLFFLSFGTVLFFSIQELLIIEVNF